MQQTEKYKLNKPESTDTFSVSPLNENADKLETQLARLDGADAAETAARQALDLRVTALEVQKIFFGTFAGNGSEQTIDLGFKPLAVLLIDRENGGPTFLAVGEHHAYHRSETAWVLKIVENGFNVCTDGGYFNRNNHPYNYIVFL